MPGRHPGKSRGKAAGPRPASPWSRRAQASGKTVAASGGPSARRRGKGPGKAKVVSDEPQRIQKRLATAGIGSRREIEGWIREGRLQVNGKNAQLGDRIVLTDRVSLDGKSLRLDRIGAARQRVLLYYKPEGEVTSRRDPDGRRTVFESLPPIRDARWIAIGRLDYNTSGLLVFTSDGTLANHMMHPSSEIEREYSVRVLGEIGFEQRKALLDGVELEDGVASFDSIKEMGGEGRNQWYAVTLQEGRNREVRRLMESQGLVVSRLIRTRFGPLDLPRWLVRGKWAELTSTEVEGLLKGLNLESHTRYRSPGRRPGRPNGGVRRHTGGPGREARRSPGRRSEPGPDRGPDRP